LIFFKRQKTKSKSVIYSLTYDIYSLTFCEILDDFEDYYGNDDSDIESQFELSDADGESGAEDDGESGADDDGESGADDDGESGADDGESEADDDGESGSDDDGESQKSYDGESLESDDGERLVESSECESTEVSELDDTDPDTEDLLDTEKSVPIFRNFLQFMTIFSNFKFLRNVSGKLILLFL